jgi:hypothetical protein
LKKFLAIAVSALFVLGLAGSAFAIHAEIPEETQAVVIKGTTQLTLDGSIRFRGEVRDNTFNDSRGMYDARFRLGVNAAVSDNVTGYLQIEAGNGQGADTYTWGDANGSGGNYGSGNAKRGEFDVLQGWILYTNDAVNLKVGHMPLALGYKIFFDHTKFGDDAILLFKDVDNWHLAALTAKFEENLNPAADDADAYVVLAVYKGDGFNVSGDVTWVNDNSGLFGDSELDLYNIGLRADGAIGPVSLKGDVEFQTGDLSATLDASGWAAMLEGSMDVGSVNLALKGGYGSGDEADSADDFEAFITSLNTGSPYVAFVYATRATSACQAPGGSNTGFCNTTFLKLSAKGNVSDALSLNGDIIWLQASEDVSLNGGDLDDDLGWEIDAKMKYKVARNLVYWIEGGYMFVGSAYDYPGDTGADDAFALRHGMELSF